MVDAPSFGGGKGLTAHVRTKAQYDYSYVEAAALRIGDDVMEIGSYGNYMINGVQDAELPATLGGYNVTLELSNKKETRFQVHLNDKDSIVLKAHKAFVGIIIDDADEADFGDSVGIMGHFGTGTLYGRDGKTVYSDMDAFGDEWQVAKDEPKLFDGGAGNERCLTPQEVQKRHASAAAVRGARLAL